MRAADIARMRVLVTGADGFIGSHTVEHLVRLGAHVRAFCFYNSNGSLGWLDDANDEVRSSIEVTLGDVRDARFVEAAAEGMDAIVHLAALIAIPYSYVAPRSFVDTNVTGTLNVLEAARRVGTTRVLQVSTSEVYGTPAELPIRESHPLNAQSPYAATKVAADQLALAFHRSFGTPVTVVRPFNTYGPRQSARAVLPSILRQLLAGRRQVKVGRLDPRRDLTYVTDTATALGLALTAPGIEGDTIHLGTGRTESIAELFAIACRIVGIDAEPVQADERLRPDASEVEVLQSDPRRAHERLGWRATVDLEEGIARTVEWLRTHPEQDVDRVRI